MSVKRIVTVSAVTGVVAALGVTASAQWGLEEQEPDQQQQQREQAPVFPQQQQEQEQQEQPRPAPMPAPRAAAEPEAIEGADIEQATAEQRAEADVVIGVMNLQDVARAYDRMRSVQRLVERDEGEGGFWLDPGALDEDPIDADMLETARDTAEAVADDDVDLVVAEHLQGQPENVALVDMTRPVVEQIHERAQEYREQLEAAVPAQPAQPAPGQGDRPEREPLELPALPEDDQDDGVQDDSPFEW